MNYSPDEKFRQGCFGVCRDAIMQTSLLLKILGNVIEIKVQRATKLRLS